MRWTYLNTERRLSNQDRLSPSEYSVGVLRKLQIDRDAVVAILLVDVERVQPDLIKGYVSAIVLSIRPRFSSRFYFLSLRVVLLFPFSSFCSSTTTPSTLLRSSRFFLLLLASRVWPGRGLASFSLMLVDDP